MEKGVNRSRILIIDDDSSYQRLLERCILRHGGQCDFASDGRMGLNKAQNNNYDLIFVDIKLPKLDGFMVTILLRESGYQMPLIGMTSLKVDELDSKASAVGFNELLAKPITEEDVIRFLKSDANKIVS